MTHVAWTGDGTLPTGNTLTPQAFEIGLSEPMDPASAANATATLTPDGGYPVTLTITLAADSRTAYFTGAAVAAGTQYTLHIDGLTDTSHNPIWPEDVTVTITDPNAYEVLDDTTAPQLLAVLDAPDALYLLFDEPVEPAAGYAMTTAVSIVRSGQPVDGAATRLTANLLQWQPADEAGGLVPGGTYTLTAARLTDLAGNAAASATFTHLATSDQMLLLAYQAPSDTQPEAQSAYGLTNLFQGRSWHAELGAYYYRARWYLPEAGVFGERDPSLIQRESDPYSLEHANPASLLDPLGLDWAEYNGVAIVWFEGKSGERKNRLAVYPATSGLWEHDSDGKKRDYQKPEYTRVQGRGPIPEGTYYIYLQPDPNRVAKVDSRTGDLYWNREGGIERIPQSVPVAGSPGYVWTFPGWGTIRAQLTPDPRNDMKGRHPSDRFYVHNSHKGYTHGCVETSTEFFNRLLAYRAQHPEEDRFVFVVRYTGETTRGDTERADDWPPLTLSQ